MISIDIPPLEASAIACTVFFPVTRVLRGVFGWDERPDVLMLFLDLLRGAAFFPFLILTAGAFSSDILQSLANGSRLHVFLAGVIGAASVFKSDRWMIEFARRSHRQGAVQDPPNGVITEPGQPNL
jgi:hypothetical protein